MTSPPIRPHEGLPGKNPFRESTVAQLEAFDDSIPIGTGPAGAGVHIPGRTSAWLTEHIEAYLRHQGEPETRGRAIALVGEFGLGKSHLAREATRLLRKHVPPLPLWVISQPSIDMRTVYQERLTSPRDDFDAFVDFKQAITDFYADVTAEILSEDDTDRFGADRAAFLDGLRARRLDPQKIVQAFNLDEERIQHRLRRHLRGVTAHRTFAVALAQLFNRPFENDVWNWLSGGEPVAYLQERGIREPIRSIQQVFDALAVFSLVYGKSGRPYALVLDELDKTTEWPEQDRAVFINAFEMLVERYVNQGGLLLFCARPELWGRLPLSLHERVLPLWLDSWGAAETDRLIAEHVHRADPPPAGADSAPFAEPALREIVLQSDGVPRQILQICEGAWDQAVGREACTGDGDPAPRSVPRPPREIGLTDVHAALRAAHGKREMAEVAHRLQHVLAPRQWWHHMPPVSVRGLTVPREGGEPRWVQVTRKAWIALLPVPSVLTQGDVHAVQHFVDRVRSVLSPENVEVLVVVNGHACREMRNRVAEHCGTVPLVFDDPRFESMLLNGVRSLIERLRANGRNAVLGEVRDQLETITTQQAMLADRIDAVDHAVNHPRLPAPPPGPDTADPRVPPPVRAPFRQAQAALDRLLEDGVGPRPRLGPAAPGVEGARAALPRRATTEQTALQAMGALLYARRLVEAFREAVTHWWESGDADARSEQDLFTVCRSFEISVEVLPRVDAGESGPGAGSPGGGVEEVLTGLADTVWRALREEVSADPDAARR
ncbi:hypothetical protein GTY75_22760 [Streptomyces sp. SID8381]|uniref:hypothetical protein n=1 Tax=unclassified Streptomyces TaxID=2593676 RepID=UPI000369F155|nr:MULTISPECIES: hypothetical protein [unclassified Streptomyces]MYX29422.1 hypothetical protein [Streptomyces sp. SID8381]